jgi:hypothetical protein
MGFDKVQAQAWAGARSHTELGGLRHGTRDSIKLRWLFI